MKRCIFIIIALCGIIFKILYDYSKDLNNFKEKISDLESKNEYLKSIIDNYDCFDDLDK